MLSPDLTQAVINHCIVRVSLSRVSHSIRVLIRKGRVVVFSIRVVSLALELGLRVSVTALSVDSAELGVDVVDDAGLGLRDFSSAHFSAAALSHSRFVVFYCFGIVDVLFVVFVV